MLEKGSESTNKGWRRLYSPHPAINSEEEKRKAQLIIFLSLASLLISLVWLAIMAYLRPGSATTWSWGLAWVPLVFLAVYILSLTTHYRRAIWGLLVGLLLFPLVLGLSSGAWFAMGFQDVFLWAMLSIGFAILLLPPRELGIYSALYALELLAAGLLAPTFVTQPLFPSFLAALLVLFLLGLRFKSSNQGEQREDAVVTNRRLQTRTQDLESSLVARAGELEQIKREFQAFADDSPLAVLRLDRDMRIVYANPTAREVFSLPDAANGPGLPLMEQQFDPEMGQVASFLATLLLKVFETEADLHTQSATGEREFEWWLTVERNADGQATSILARGMDISEQRRSERQLVESEARFRTISDAAPMGIYVSNPGGACLYCNQMFRTITGLSEEEIGAGKRDEIIHPEDRERLLAMRAQLLSTPPYTFESVHRFLRKDGRIVWVNSKEAPMWDGGNLIGFVGVVEDITIKIDEINARLESEESLRRRSEELETAVAELEGFTYTVAHDLRAPLRAIDGFANILQREYHLVLPNDGIRLLDTIRNSAQQMGHLIDDLLSFSRLGRQALSMQMVEMGELLSQVLDTFEEEIQTRGIKVSVAPLQACYGDPTLLRQVWTNLISNSIKFTRPVAQPEIEIGCTQATGKLVVYYVRDNGAGFDMAFAGKLFGVFQRLHRPDEFEGTGVGLAIVQRVVQRHEGKVWAKGVTGQGATFFFAIPSQPRPQSETGGNSG